MFMCVVQFGCTTTPSTYNSKWISLLNDEDLSNWISTGTADWDYNDGILTGTSSKGKGHLYGGPQLTDMEVRGYFRLSTQGGKTNSGLYFRAKPFLEKPESWPRGYEAQIRHTQEGYTGCLWKSGFQNNPVATATKILTKDNEWFKMRVQAIDNRQKIWINDELVLENTDSYYSEGQIAIQVHNAGMKIEVKDLEYLDLSRCKNL